MAPLRFCVPDAKLFADVLVQKCTYPKENVLLMTDEQPPELLPTKGNILRQLTMQLKKMNKGDTLLFYYSGHGGLGHGPTLMCVQDAAVAGFAPPRLHRDEVRAMLPKLGGLQ